MATRATPATTRDDMLDAARSLIGDIGYAGMSHADITAAVGMGRTTFYEHFASKEDLLVELVSRDLPPVTAEILASVDSSLPPQERLHELSFRMVEFVGTDHIGLILHTEVPKLSPEAQRSISDSHRGIADEFAQIYDEGVESGVFRALPGAFVGRMMQAIVMTGGRAVMDSRDPSTDVGTIATNTADTLIAALRPVS
ncbi:MAG: TetR/AcrR family transcriptional regulator [Acidimicrobiia bacterium]|nr:TetR/AcrR family transcriptional regulator [Acidimicrobiia bacterium]